jgi:hypothetical protein
MKPFYIIIGIALLGFLVACAVSCAPTHNWIENGH